MTYFTSSVHVIAASDSSLLPAGMPWALEQVNVSVVSVLSVVSLKGKRQHPCVTRHLDTKPEVRHR